MTVSVIRGERHRGRSKSTQGFEELYSSAAASTMRKELDKLVASHPDSSAQAHVKRQMDMFFMLFTRYLVERSQSPKIDWAKIKGPTEGMVSAYKDLKPIQEGRASDLLSKLAVLKLNGGLGTTMGCVGPKSVIQVREGLTFLDLNVMQIQDLNTTHKVDVPLILMNSFNTDKDTKRVIQKYQGHQVKIQTFNQSQFPRISSEGWTLCPEKANDPDLGNWYPPGHGDLFESLENSGLLDKLLAEGKEYVFVSNIDNLGATVDLSLLQHVVDNDCEFLMEVTNKTKADVKGGTIIDYEGHVRLLEIAQVPPEHTDDFKSVRKFKIFNTNNLWINLKAIKRLVTSGNLKLDLIANVKDHSKFSKVLQLETAVGAAIRYFENAGGVNVPRSRFLPVKSTSDLFLITSDLYHIDGGTLRMNPERMFGTTPNIKLGNSFKKVGDFLERFKTPPAILDLDHLSVTGNVWFGADVTLKGTVIVVANDESRIDIPSGSILDDKVVTGYLRVLDH